VFVLGLRAGTASALASESRLRAAGWMCSRLAMTQAKASLSAFIKSLGLRPRDTGDLSMAHWLEGACCQ
jgi:predicted dinucleotide-binding enzyme